MPKRLLTVKRLPAILVAVMFAVSGMYWLLGANAASQVPNPPLASCGLDVAMLVDTSGSMDDGNQDGISMDSMRAITRAAQSTHTMISVGYLDLSVIKPFSADTNAILNHINQLDVGNSSYSRVGDLRRVTALDTRPERQNLILLFSDFLLGAEGGEEVHWVGLDAVKQSGTRILAVVTVEGKTRATAVSIAGPKIYAGNVLTADVIWWNSIAEATQQLVQYLKQPCTVNDGGGGSKPSIGKGNDGKGAGTKGTGQGGGGGGGSSANTPSNKPNTIPTTSNQGNTRQPTITPSPFYDGKEYAPGSDPLDKALGNISVAGRKIAHGWMYLLLLIIVIAGVSGYYWWWKRLSPKEQSRLRAKLQVWK